MEEQAQPSETEQQNNHLPPKITKETLTNVTWTKKKQVLYWSKTIFCLLLSSFLISFAAYSLIRPNDFTIGGVSGIAVLINKASDGKINQSIIILSFNAPLIILSFFLVKKRFAILSMSNIILQSLWLSLFENVFPDCRIAFEMNGEKIFAAIAAGLCVGAAIGLAFKIGGSTGGTDIVAVMIQKRFSATSIASMLFIINCAVIGSSIFVFHGPEKAFAYRLLPVMMSAFEAYIESRTIDSLTNGLHSAIEFRIITDKPDEIATALMTELSRGVTLVEAKGMYTKEEHSMLVCVISKRQVATLKRIIKSVDPDSFAVMTHVSQVLGLGFYANET